MRSPPTTRRWRAIYRAKGRPAHNPLIVHVADLAGARAIARFDERAEARGGGVLAGAADPGPAPGGRRALVPASRPPAWTPSRSASPPTPSRGRCSRRCCCPLAAPSANPSGLVSPTTAAHVAADLGAAVDLVLDGGPCPVGVESSVLDLSRAAPRLLRPGGLDRAALERLVGPLGRACRRSRSHAAPGSWPATTRPACRCASTRARSAPGEALLAFGPDPLPGGVAVRNLSPAGDPAEAARNLFAMLRELDASGAAGIAVMPIPAEGLGEAVRDRLRRAAAPRPGRSAMKLR